MLLMAIYIVSIRGRSIVAYQASSTEAAEQRVRDIDFRDRCRSKGGQRGRPDMRILAVTRTADERLRHAADVARWHRARDRHPTRLP